MTIQSENAPWHIGAESEEIWFFPIPAERLHRDDLGETVFIDLTGHHRVIGALKSFTIDGSGDVTITVEAGVDDDRVQFHLKAMDMVCRLIDPTNPNRPRQGFLFR